MRGAPVLASKRPDRIRAAAWRYVGYPATRLALGVLLRLLLCSAKQAKQAAAALPPVYALTCDQRQVKCGMQMQPNALVKKSAAQNCGSHERGGGEEDGKGCRVRSAQSGRRRDEVMKFMCRHAVGDKVARPPNCRQYSFVLNGWCVVKVAIFYIAEAK